MGVSEGLIGTIHTNMGARPRPRLNWGAGRFPYLLLHSLADSRFFSNLRNFLSLSVDGSARVLLAGGGPDMGG